jgi:hypothetical protein
MAETGYTKTTTTTKPFSPKQVGVDKQVIQKGKKK